MASDDTVVMEWWYATPCGRCGKDVRIGKDASKGKVKFAGTGGKVTARCTACGHEDTYPSTAVDNKRFG